MDDLISRQWLLSEYDKRHKGPPGGARKLIEEAPSAQPKLLQPWEVLVAQAVLSQPKMGKWLPADSFTSRSAVLHLL